MKIRKFSSFILIAHARKNCQRSAHDLKGEEHVAIESQQLFKMHDARRKKLQYYCWSCMGTHISISSAGPCLNFFGKRRSHRLVLRRCCWPGCWRYWIYARMTTRTHITRPTRKPRNQTGTPRFNPLVQAPHPPHQVYRLQKCSKINYRYIAWSGYSSLQVHWQ